MWPSRDAERQRIAHEIQAAKAAQGLLGVPDATTIDTLAMQFVASLRREDYYRLIQTKPIAPRRADPNSPSFDAERAVAFWMQRGNVDEAAWIIFLMTYFSRHRNTSWLRLQDIYSRLGSGIWDWPTVVANPTTFFDWLDLNWQSVRGAFGNHRKYESLRPTAKRPLKQAVWDYLTWIGPGGHRSFFAKAVRSAGNNPQTIYDHLYGALRINSFGRLAKFDYLMLISRYKLVPIEPGSAYLDGATGPGRGARLLFDGTPTSTTSNSALQVKLDILDARLKVGMAVMEDALCNWQKSPQKFIHYKG